MVVRRGTAAAPPLLKGLVGRMGGGRVGGRSGGGGRLVEEVGGVVVVEALVDGVGVEVGVSGGVGGRRPERSSHIGGAVIGISIVTWN